MTIGNLDKVLSDICGENNFTIWNKESHTFGSCFEKLCFTITAHVILAVCSSYHLSRHHSRRVRGNIPQSHVLNIRFLVTFFLCLMPCILIIIGFSSHKVNTSIISIVSWVVDAGSFLLHSSFIWKLKSYYHLHIRGPVQIVISFLTTTVALLFHLYNIIIDVTEKKQYIDAIEEYFVYVKVVFHFVYLCTLLPSKRPSLRTSNIHRTAPNTSINVTDSEEQPLLRSLQGVNRSERNNNLGVAEDGKNCVSRLFFLWANPMMYKGYLQKISKSEDLFELPRGLRTPNIVNKFQNAITVIKTKNEASDSGQDRISLSQNECAVNIVNPDRNKSISCQKDKISLIRTLNKTFGIECWSLGILKFLGDSLNFAGPILLNLLVSYMENSKEVTWHGYLYASGLFLSTFISSMISTHFGYRISVLGLKVRAALITNVYKKALNVSTVSLSKFSTGEIVNFMSTDTDRIVNFAPSFHQFWSLPIQVGISLYLLYNEVGLAFLAGIGFAILLIPINRWLAIRIGQLSTSMMNQKDRRVKIMNEILFGIRVIKFYAWEKHFNGKVELIRDAELESLKGRKYLDAWCVFFWATTTVMISILTFTTYVLLGHQLTAAKVFTSIALFNILIMPLNAFPWTINGLMEAWVSVKRIEKYLQLSELDFSQYYTESIDGGELVTLDKSVFSWNSQCEKNNSPGSGNSPKVEEQDKKFYLRNLSAHIPKGHFVGIFGKVGCGKSSFLNVILAEMYKEEGTISVSCLSEGFGYAAQEAWIQHATVKENILFGKPYMAEKYESVLDACALREDLKVLPGGDLTEIGENGVTLSGGQKARVALARAVYQDKSVYLLDDPFAAVDAHVASHLYNNCIKGLLKDKTIILCTHHTNFLQHADHVILLENGQIAKQGPPIEVLTNIEFSTLKGKSEQEAVEEEEMSNVEQAGLVEEEEQDTGVVKFEVYKSYWLAVGKCLAPTVLLSLFLMQASKNLSDWWLSYWVTHSHTSHSNVSTSGVGSDQTYTDDKSTPWKPLTYGDDNVTFYLSVYGGIVGANVIFAFVRSFSFAYGGVCAATKIHLQLIDSILKAPIKFFDTTPIGRILNRFSSDMYAVDDSLPFILNIFLAQFYGLMGSLILTCYGLPWFIVVLVPLAILYYFVQKYYRHTSREVKRISSVTLSPIYAHFSETVTGLTTVRAIREQRRFEEVNCFRLEQNQRSQLAVSVASTWLGIRLQMIGVAMVTSVAFIAVLEHHFRSVNPVLIFTYYWPCIVVNVCLGLVGLAISYALSVTQLISGMVQFFTETEKQMVSVERVSQYIQDIPHENQDSLISTPHNWPSKGALCFKNVKLQYRSGLPFALDEVSFNIQPKEKIGIVGRTGSGKSSLFLTLFRMVDINSGAIEIDGINISYLPLTDLRSRMAIIPQDPFLFSGTIRENLDPEGKNNDLILQQVIDRCYLTDVVERLGGLDAEVHERGRDFSVGQRQLMCLARALLTRAKILCIDEATASVDRDTDEKVQLTIQSEFSDNTVLTIAHRISTVQHSDRVLVMNAAKVHEFDTPENLMNDQQSMFYSLITSKL